MGFLGKKHIGEWCLVRIKFGCKVFGLKNIRHLSDKH